MTLDRSIKTAIETQLVRVDRVFVLSFCLNLVPHQTTLLGATLKSAGLPPYTTADYDLVVHPGLIVKNERTNDS